MKKNSRSFEPHLALRELALLPGREWQPQGLGWSLVQVKSGHGYCLQTQGSTELPTGTVLLLAGDTQASIRASQLGDLALCTFGITPSRLTGLITLGEQDFLKTAAARKDFTPRILPSQSPVAVKMTELCAGQKPAGLLFRLQLLQLFVEAVGNELEQIDASQNSANARERLQSFLKETPPDVLAEMTLEELAVRTHCTQRHLSRIFNELVGMSFGEKRSEIRMARARELLASSNSKVVEVALESGYQSLSLFNLVFTRRFGMSPGRWRQKYASQTGGKNTRPLAA